MYICKEAGRLHAVLQKGEATSMSPAALTKVAAQEQSTSWVLHTLCHLNKVLQDLTALGIATLDVQAAHSYHEISAGHHEPILWSA